MEESTNYSRTYLTGSGPKWTIDYDFSKNKGIIKEISNDKELCFKIHYGKLKFTEDNSKEEMSKISENELKWIDICVDEILFLRKN